MWVDRRRCPALETAVNSGSTESPPPYEKKGKGHRPGRGDVVVVGATAHRTTHAARWREAGTQEDQRTSVTGNGHFQPVEEAPPTRRSRPDTGVHRRNPNQLFRRFRASSVRPSWTKLARPPISSLHLRDPVLRLGRHYVPAAPRATFDIDHDSHLHSRLMLSPGGRQADHLLHRHVAWTTHRETVISTPTGYRNKHVATILQQ